MKKGLKVSGKPLDSDNAGHTNSLDVVTVKKGSTRHRWFPPLRVYLPFVNNFKYGPY